MVNRLLSQDSGLSVVLENNQRSGLGFINMMDDEYLPDMLDAIATRIRNSQ
ncbi:MAG TPA: hypothetical protein V6C63_07790 [Allocoleopsis sp.]